MSSSDLEHPCPMCGGTITRATVECPHCGETLGSQPVAPRDLDLCEMERQLLQKLRRQSRLLATIWVLLSGLFCGIGGTCLIIFTIDLLSPNQVSTPWGELFTVGFTGVVLGTAMAILASACRARKFWAFYANLSLSYLFLAIGLILGSPLLILLLIGHVVLSHSCLRTARRMIDANIPLDYNT